MEQYRLLAECLLPGHMLDWFDLKNVRVEKKRSMPNPHTFTGDPLFPAKTLSLYKKMQIIVEKMTRQPKTMEKNTYFCRLF